MNAAPEKNEDCLAELEGYVVNGYVLDDEGQWVTIAGRKRVEEEVLAHLVSGRVLHAGHWLTFDEVRAAQAQAAAAAVQPEDAQEETRAFEVSP